MGLFRRKNIPAHKLHPDVLHWREGDEIVARNIKVKGPISKVMAFEVGKLNITYYYKGLTDDGFIILEEKETGHLDKVAFKKFIKHAKNMSFKNRSLKQDLEQSKDHMELIDEFQKAYNELQVSDKNRKLLE